ncbi:N-acetyltransferase [Lysinibacillus sp. KU-BSD001]|uniref:N-acetyltransferase n=1 Tax=Lysinibacillus sp. KU-BSD001 TaxID=3141328 RepID=UPI0036E952C5
MLIRKAKVADVPGICKLIEKYAKTGELLIRTHASICEDLLSFYVAVEDDEVIGVGSLYIYDESLSEIRSLAVSEGHMGKGVGKKISQKIVEDAEQLGIGRMISLTYQIEFFSKLGFQVIEKETIPQKVRKDCLGCPKFFACDETAMVINLN